VYGGKLFRFAEHLDRLNNSLAAIDISNPYSDAEWATICNKVVVENPASGDRSLYIQVTRGAGEREHLYPDGLVPTVLVMCRAITPRNYDKNGITAVTRPDIRWQFCHIKAITLLANVMLKQQAFREEGANEVILIRDGMVTEGAASNVFVVKDGTVFTPPKDGSILPGITRDLVVELLHEAGIACRESTVTEQELLHADEVWITGSIAGVAPVVSLNGIPVGDGKPGKVWQQANLLFQQFKSDLNN
jgi:D-alanine transaminase